MKLHSLIQEGLIKVPKKLSNNVYGWFMSKYFTYIYAKAKLTDVYDLDDKMHRAWYQEVENKAKNFRVNLDAKAELGFKNGKFEQSFKIDPSWFDDFEYGAPKRVEWLKLVLDFNSSRTYIQTKGLLSIVIGMERFSDKDKIDTSQSIYKANKHIHSAVEHELMHMMQMIFFAEKDPKQVSQKYGDAMDDKDRNTKHVLSNIEFNPNLKTASDEFISATASMITTADDPEKLFRYFLRFYVCVDNLPNLHHTTFSESDFKRIRNFSEMEFKFRYIFDTLKKEAPVRYKKAVRIFSTEVKKKIHAISDAYHQGEFK